MIWCLTYDKPETPTPCTQTITYTLLNVDINSALQSNGNFCTQSQRNLSRVKAPLSVCNDSSARKKTWQLEHRLYEGYGNFFHILPTSTLWPTLQIVPYVKNDSNKHAY